MQTVCGTQVSSGRAILETSQDDGGGGGEVLCNYTVVMDNGGGEQSSPTKCWGRTIENWEGGWVTGILQTYSGESSKFYFDTTKILYPPPAKQLAIKNNDHSLNKFLIKFQKKIANDYV